MRIIYTFLLYLCSPLFVLRLYWKSRKLPAYRARLAERFSVGSILTPPVDVWLHAVSLGEVVAATPLIEQLLKKQLRVLVTTMTPTGSEQVKRRFGDRVAHQYIPYDFPRALRRFFSKIQPRAGIIMETELWPNLIEQASRAKIPLFLANARISNRAYPQYHAIRWFLKPLLNRFMFIMAQSALDQSRFIQLGAAAEKVLLPGNMKFDLQVVLTQEKLVQSLKETWGFNRPVLLLASTHENEEKQILSYLRLLQEQIPHLIVLIAPRHPERFEPVYQNCIQQQFITGRRSIVASIQDTCEVIILDSLGELLSFFSVSDYAFVGGSLVPVGGHNVLEPIALKVPVFCGPYMQNSQSIIDELLKEGALIQAKDSLGLVNSIIQMHQQPVICNQQVRKATQILEANQGSVQRHLDVIQQYALGKDLLSHTEEIGN